MDQDPAANEQLTQRLAVIERLAAYLNFRMGRPLSDDEVKDVVQESYEVLFRRLPEYEALAPLESWFYGILQLQLRDAIRRRARRRAQEQSLDDIDPPSPQHLDKAVLDAAEIEHCLRLMGGMEAKVVRLYYLEGRKFAEIAAMLDLPLGTAKSMHLRGFKRLREMLEQSGGAE